MRAAVLRRHDQPFAIEEIELSPLGHGELLVEIASAGMCHTDMLPRNPLRPLAPMILGHEGAGIVREVGPGVTRVVPGDHVVLTFDSCGWCDLCLQGAPAYCAHFMELNVDGARLDGATGAKDADGHPVANRWFGQSSFAELAIATERNTVVVDKDLPLELLGPLGCSLQTGAGTVLNEMQLVPGQSIAVFGAGAVGLAAVMAAKIAGAADIVIVDLHHSRLEMARELGATRAVKGDVDDLVAAVRGPGSGLDFTLDTTAVGSVISATVAVLARRGKAVLVGAGNGQLVVNPAMLAGKTVTFVLEGSSIPQIFVPQLIEHWRAGRFPFDRIIRTYALDNINQAETDALSGATIKPVLTFAR